jgi:tetratricopeptide (TPR) repeat protein
MSHSIFDMRRHPLALCLCALTGFAAFAPAAYSADKPKGQEISRAIAKEMTAAQKAMAANQWSEVLKDLEGLDSRPGLTAYDKTKINDFRGYSYVKLQKLKEAETAYEAAIAAGGYTAEELAQKNHLLFQVAAQNQQNAKAIEYGKSVTETNQATPNDFLVMAQLYYLQKDCKNSGIWSDKAVAAFKKANEQPKEVLYQIKLQCASDSGDTGAMKAGLYDLVRVTNKTSYWNNLIRLERQDERDDKNTLMIYRIMYDTNSMNADTDYIEMAQLLGDAGLPGEAAAVLDKAMSTNQIKDEHKERTTRLAAALKLRADADKKGLPALDAEASKNAAGQLDVKLGEVYFGAGDYQGAVTAINRGIGKGQVKDLDQAYVYLGRAQVALKNNGEAKKAFEKLKTVPNISPRVLKLWELYSDKLGS